MFDLYKPFRNDLRRNALFPSLYVLWSWSLYLEYDDLPVRSDIEVPLEVRLRPKGPPLGIYPWQLASLAKQLLINSPLKASEDFRTWKRFSNALNNLKALDDGITKRYERLWKQQILVELHRIAHHQFPWQHEGRAILALIRYYKIFSYPKLDSIIASTIGMTTDSLYKIGMSVSGHFLGTHVLDLPANSQLAGVSNLQVDWFLRNYSREIEPLKKLCAASESMDQDFNYSANPLAQYPLISFKAGAKEYVIAPIHRFLIRRFTEGVYYDIINSPGFNEAFGESYQKYIGEVIDAANSQQKFLVLEEKSYAVGTHQKRTVDWIIADQSAVLFVECKTKRLLQRAKIALADTTVLSAELEKLSSFIVQVYKTLADAIDGRYPHFKPDARVIYPVVVTLEEWYVQGPRLVGEVQAKAAQALQEAGLDVRLLRDYPPLVCSAADFESCCQIAQLLGIQAVMDAVHSPTRAGWTLHTILFNAFPKEYAATRGSLFPTVMEKFGVAS